MDAKIKIELEYVIRNVIKSPRQKITQYENIIPRLEEKINK